MNIGFLGLLQLIFIVLKLTEVIAWSWFYVLIPSIFIVSLVISIFTGLIYYAYKK